MKGLCCVLCLLSAPCWAAAPDDGLPQEFMISPAAAFTGALPSPRAQAGERLLALLGLNRLLPQWQWQHRDGKGDTKLRLQLEPDGEVQLKLQLRW